MDIHGSVTVTEVHFVHCHVTLPFVCVVKTFGTELFYYSINKKQRNQYKENCICFSDGMYMLSVSLSYF
jgi:hypothetical protein